MTRRTNFPLQRIEAELAVGERVLWIGKPNATYHAFYADDETSAALTVTAIAMIILILLTLMIGGNAWGISLLAMVVMGLAVGIQITASYLDARSTTYAVTNRRAILLQGERLHAYDAIDFIEVRGNERIGTVVFDRKAAVKLVPVGYSVEEHTYTTDIGFNSIPEPLRVVRLLASVFELPTARITDTTTQPSLQPAQQAS